MATSTADTFSLPNDCVDAEGVVLDVGGVIFTVARGRLVQDSLVFRDMFSLHASADVPVANESQNSEGTRLRPIPICDTDPQSFREFLWAMRARAKEITNFIKSPPSQEKALKLVSIARLAHKFQDFPLLEWTLPELHQAFRSGQIYLGPKVLSAVFNLLALLDRDDASVREIVEDVGSALKRQAAHVAEHNPPTAEIPSLFIDPFSLIENATSHGFTGVLADAYYHVLLLPADFLSSSSRLSIVDMKRLLTGASILGEKWFRLRAHIARVPQALRSIDLDIQAATKHPADLRGKLQLARSALKHSVWSHVELDAEVDQMITTFRDELPGVFGRFYSETPFPRGTRFSSR